MPALPLPEVPPPDTPDDLGTKPRVGSAREQRRDRTRSPVSATVRLCLVDPAADADEIVTAAVSMITTTYTAPGDRIMLADAEAPATGSVPTRRDRLVESVLRLGRGASTGPHLRHHSNHELAAAASSLRGTPAAESGLGPRPGDAVERVASPPCRPSPGEPSGPGSDGFALITAGWSDHPADPLAFTRWSLALAPSGTVVVLTLSSDQCASPAARSEALSRDAALAGLTLTARLILAHETPSAPRTVSRQGQRTIDLGSHHNHTTASVFRRPAPSTEALRA